jgi:hypothetical protein
VVVGAPHHPLRRYSNHCTLPVRCPRSLSKLPVGHLINPQSVYVGMPRIAQDEINKSTLSFPSISFTQPTVDSITLAASAVQHSSSIFTPTIDPFNVTKHLVTDGITVSDSITGIAIPRIHAYHPNTDITVAPQEVPIISFDQVSDFAIGLLSQPNVTVRMAGNTKLHEGALPVINIKYNSSMTFNGLLHNLRVVHHN